MAQRPLVLIHGYSDEGRSFQGWKDKLVKRGYPADRIHICSYVSLANEVSIKDLAEGLNRALLGHPELEGDQEFDAIVHSTGMLVIRAWLVKYAAAVSRLKHLVAIAPATFGSPLAHKGRSWLGAIFKGNKQPGPDFMEAGDRVLDGLELGSRFTWDLAHEDLLGNEPFYGPTRRTPWVFVFCGNKSYGGLRGLLNEPGTDGTVRWAGCALNSRKILLDLTREQSDARRVTIAPWVNLDIPLVFAEGLNHGTIISDPSDELVDSVHAALQVNSLETFKAWQARAAIEDAKARADLDTYQQFVVRAVDERGDPIDDYNLKLVVKGANRESPLYAFAADVHAYSTDPSLRCFHVNLTKLKPTELLSGRKELHARIMASAGSGLVGYQGYAEQQSVLGSFELNISRLMGDVKVTFFYPFTTTLVEIRINREPLPLTGTNKVLWFLAQ